jgi:hypothetical protein
VIFGTGHPRVGFVRLFLIFMESHMLRSSVIGIGLAVTVLAFQVGGCSSGGSGGGKGGSAGTSSPGAGGNSSPGAGGNSSPGAGGSGGNSSPGAGGTGGSSSPGAGGSGGASAGGTGGASAGGTGGASAGGTGGASAGGASGSGAGGTPGFGLPSCASNVAKNGPCTATDQQLCYKTCGPSNVGRKSETCGPGADGGMTYTEMTGCAYDPLLDYACYKLPTAANAACPTGIPMGSASCTVDACVVCNDMGGVAGGMYMDSSGAKQGFCVCAGGKWTCASNTAWPCGGTPVANNPGCQ